MKILAIKTNKLRGIPAGRIIPMDHWEDLQDDAEYIERGPAETDPTYRQIIPYTLVQNKESGMIVTMRRESGQTEERLHGKVYVGCGGHVEEGHGIVYTALKEATEELGLPIAALQTIGMFYTQGSPVDDVHLAAFFHAQTHYHRFTSPEMELHSPCWMTVEGVAEHYDNMENWSKLVQEKYIASL